MTKVSAHEFVFRGLLAEEALDKAGRVNRYLSGMIDSEVATALSIDLLDEVLVDNAKRMSIVYTAIAAFENTVRKLIVTVLQDEIGEKWWESGVPEKVRNSAEKKRSDEEQNRWHSIRGGDPINYTQIGDLIRIIDKNWQVFEPYIPSLAWAHSIISVVERSRHVIMHSGVLDDEDMERLGINIRDWIKQVGS